MRNITELIGIIKGIDFDGVINEKETEKLEEWVARNRNLAYEPRDIKFINLIDDILEDHIITDEEKEILIESCDRFLGEMVDSPSIYVLQGIVQGIISDGVINGQEVERLQEWMDKNRASLTMFPKCKLLVDTIDDVLEDGIITEEEQTLLQEVFAEQIEATQFENKIAYLKKLIKNKKNIGVDLIDLLGSDDDISRIHSIAEVELGKALVSYSGISSCDTEIVFISLVLIAMLHYEDGRFYESVRETYDKLYDRYSAQKIEGFIRSILSKYRNGNDQNERLINSALYNAIVPSHYLATFFEFIYDIYERNFEYNLSDDMYEDFMFVYEGLRQTMMSDGDDVHLNVTKKTYKLIKTTKQLIAREEYIDSIIKLSTIIVRLIDKQIWHKEIKIYNPYLKEGFETWTKNLKETTGGRERNDSGFRSRWEPKYITSNNNIYIVPPIHRIKGIYDYRTVKIEVTNGDEALFVEERPDIREIIGGYQVNIEKIQVSKPLGKIKYRVFAGEEVIYDSKDKLYREIIAFDPEGNEIKNNTDYEGSVLFCTKKEYEKISPFYYSPSYCLGAYGAHIGDAVLIGDIVFSFSALAKPGVFGDEYENTFLCLDESDKRYQVYEKVKCVVFETTNTNAKYEISFDGAVSDLSMYQYSVSKREGVDKYVVELTDIRDGIHTISVSESYQDHHTKLCSFTFAVDKGLKVERVALEEGGYIVSVDTALSNRPFVEEVQPKNYKADWIKIENSGKTYSYIIPFNFDFYSLTNEEGSWMDNNESLWIGDINSESVLYISDTSIDGVVVYGSNGLPIDEEVKLVERNFVKEARLGFLTTYKNSNDYFLILLLKNGVKKYPIMCYNKCILDKIIEINFDAFNKEVEIIPSYKGKGKVYFSIENEDGETIYKSAMLENKVPVYISDISSFINYKIQFFEKKAGLSLTGDTRLGVFNEIFYAWDDLVGKEFKISKVYYDQLVRGEFLRKQHYFNRSYVRVTEKIGQDEFLGELYTSTSRGNYDLYNLNPVSIELCGDAIDGTVELSITKDGDGLLLDFEHHGIMNNLDDPDAVDIFSYFMELKGIEFV